MLLGCVLLCSLGACGAPPAVTALSSAQISLVRDVQFEEHTVTGLVRIGWSPGTTGAVCLEQLEWQRGGLHLTAVPHGPCPDAQSPTNDQWVHVTTTPETLGALASPSTEGPGRGKVVLRIGSERHTLSGRARPGFTFAPDAVIELGHSIGPHSARIELGGLLDPRVRIVLGVSNSLDLDLPVASGSWQLRRGTRVFAQGILQLPEVLTARESFELAVEVGPAEGLGIAGGLLAPSNTPLTCRAEIELQTPWGAATVRSNLDL